MARVHAHAIAACQRTMPALPTKADVVCYCGRPETVAGALPVWPELAEARALQGWEAVISAPDVQLVCICSNNRSHAEIAKAALGMGKNVLCEKPLADSLSAAREMVLAAERASTQAAVSFNYRRVPAIALARKIILSGEIGTPIHARFAYLKDSGLEGARAQGWRDNLAEAGGGVLFDLGSHVVDLARHLLGELPSEVAGTALHVSRRSDTSPRGESDAVVDDAASVLARFPSGLSATFDLSRVASGNRNGLRFEVNGTKGSLRFSLERLNELELASTGGAGKTFTGFYVTETSHPWMADRWPPSHPIGWEHTFMFQAYDLLSAIAHGTKFEPTFQDGLAVQSVLAAAYSAAAAGQWKAIEAT